MLWRSSLTMGPPLEIHFQILVFCSHLYLAFLGIYSTLIHKLPFGYHQELILGDGGAYVLRLKRFSIQPYLEFCSQYRLSVSLNLTIQDLKSYVGNSYVVRTVRQRYILLCSSKKGSGKLMIIQTTRSTCSDVRIFSSDTNIIWSSWTCSLSKNHNDSDSL